MIASSVGPYRVVKQLGSGGMGMVYLAEDTRLGRKVALKTIRGASLDARERLRQEARAVAALNHPNIAAIYDIVEEGDVAYIVMEYVDGATLAQRLHYGPMIPGEALEVVAQMLEALDHAHSHGVVHHDLKPANVSLAGGGKVKILDFGIARLHPLTVSGATTQSAGVGRVFGTPGYCAPEQLLGAVGDRRSDLYSVGVLLFELIAGRPPFSRGDALDAAVESIGPPPSLASVQPNVPPALDPVVAKAMAPAAEKRFQTASEMLAAVRRITPAVSDHPTIEIAARGAARPRPSRRWVARLLAAAATLGLVTLAGMPLARHWGAEAVLRPSVAVLPFQNHTGNPANDYLGPGLAAAISSTLARVDGLVVISRWEITQAAASGRDPQQIARDLGVRFLVQGGLQRFRDVVQADLQIVRPDGAVIWTGNYQGSGDDFPGWQGRAAAGIAAAMQINDPVMMSQQPVSPAAVTDYWQGRAMLDRRDIRGNLARAMEIFERVVKEAPGYAPAHASLGEAYWEQYLATANPEWTKRAIDEASKAIALGANDPQAHYSRAVILRGSGRLDEAEQELNTVMRMQASHPDAPRLLGNLLADRGRIEEAVQAFEKGIGLRPEYGGNYRDLGVALMKAGRYAAAERALMKATVLDPDTPHAFQQLGALYQTSGRIDDAMRLYKEAITRGPAPEAWANMGGVFHQQRKFAEAANAYEHALSLSDTSAIRRRNLGDVYMQLGRVPEARDQYQRAIDMTRVALGVNPRDFGNLSRLAVYEAKLGRTADATGHINEALAIRRDDNGVLFRQGVVLTFDRKYDAAMAALKAAVAAGYSVSTVREDDDLAPLRGRDDFKALVAAK